MTDRRETENAARRWIDGYVRAWRSNDELDIRALFTSDAEYVTDPWVAPSIGQDAIVTDWLARRDEPDSFSFEGDIVGVDDRTFFYQGVTRYTRGTVYSNLWVVRLATDGDRAESFTEWWMDQADRS